MKSIIFFTLIFILGSCNIDSIPGSSNMTKKKYALKNFNSIDVSSSFDLELIQSKDYKIVVQCNENIKEYIDVYLEEECLYVGLKGNNLFSNIDLKVTIHAPDINNIEASGASSIDIEKYKVKNLEFHLSGASDLKADLNISEHLSIEASGASDIKLKGKAKNVDLIFSGASEFSGKKLVISDELTLDSSGASSVTVTANGTLDIESSGASSVTYYGKGKVIRKDISGAGSIQHN